MDAISHGPPNKQRPKDSWQLVRNLMGFHRDLCPAHWTEKNLESFSCYWKLLAIWNSSAAVANKRSLELLGRGLPLETSRSCPVRSGLWKNILRRDFSSFARLDSGCKKIHQDHCQGIKKYPKNGHWRQRKSEEWALEGLAKSNLGGAVLTSEAAAKEDGGLDWVADIPAMQRHPVELLKQSVTFVKILI